MAQLEGVIEGGAVINVEIIGTGPQGRDGYTPIKGVDYFTPSEVASIESNAAEKAAAAASQDIAAETRRAMEAENQLKDDIVKKEPLHTILSATLVTGETTLTFTDDAITDNAMIYIYTNAWGVQPSMVEQSGNTMTLTFDAQSADIGVKVEVR